MRKKQIGEEEWNKFKTMRGTDSIKNGPFWKITTNYSLEKTKYS